MTSKQLLTTEPQADSSSVAWWNPLHWPAGIWVLLIALGLMTTPFVIRAFMLAGIPEMPEPFDEVAYSTWNVPAADDAFTYYREATALHQKLAADLKAQGITDIREPEDSLLILQRGWSDATDSTKKWLELHQESLAVWRRGAQQDQGLNVLPSKLTIDSIWNVVQVQRKFVRLAILEESRLIASGELDEARQWARAGFRSGGHASNRGCMMQGLVGVAIHTVSSQALARWAEHPGVTSTQLQQALVEVRSDNTLYESLSNILKSEYLYMRNALRSPDWTHQITPFNPSGDTPEPSAKIMKMLYWTVGEPQICDRLLRQILANQIPEIDKPVATRRKMVGTGVVMLFDPNPSASLSEGQLDPAAIDRAVNRSSVTRTVLLAMAQLDNLFLKRKARQAALEALLAAQAYRRDHGEFPESLAQLVPKYLAAMPLDPCDPAGGTLLYRRDEPTEAVVWSVSEDRTDSGGDVDTTKGLAPDLGFELK
jgi:hypothetical protein